jgi:hypothetical protein
MRPRDRAHSALQHRLRFGIEARATGLDPNET